MLSNFFLLGMLVIGFLGSPKKGTSDEEQLYLTISGIKEVKGKLGLLVFNKEEGFPENPERAILELEVIVTATEMRVSLGTLPYGEYAIALVHDKNANKMLDKNLLGIPKEPFGFSNNRSILRGIPNFKDAAFTFSEERKEAKIRLINLY
jgi:uncharacterized protein (DUF2141 family)